MSRNQINFYQLLILSNVMIDNVSLFIGLVYYCYWTNNYISFFQGWSSVLKVYKFKILGLWNWLAYALAYMNK